MFPKSLLDPNGDPVANVYVVTQVIEGSPAEKYVNKGDVILGIDGHPFKTSLSLDVPYGPYQFQDSRGLDMHAGLLVDKAEGAGKITLNLIPAENVGVKHAKWDKRDGYKVGRDCYNSYFYIVEDESLNIVDKFRLHGRKYIEHLTGGSALHMNLQEHLSREQYRHLLRVASQEGCNYFTFNIPNTVCNDCGHIDKRNLKACPKCNGRNLDYLTRIIGYMKRVSNFSQARQQEAARRHYATPGQL